MLPENVPFKISRNFHGGTTKFERRQIIFRFEHRWTLRERKEKQLIVPSMSSSRLSLRKLILRLLSKKFFEDNSSGFQLVSPPWQMLLPPPRRLISSNCRLWDKAASKCRRIPSLAQRFVSCHLLAIKPRCLALWKCLTARTQGSEAAAVIRRRCCYRLEHPAMREFQLNRAFTEWTDDNGMSATIK